MTLRKSNFNRIPLDQGKHYFQYKSKNAFGVDIEIDLEPCVGGFCVAVYGGVPDILGPNLLEPKICTNSDGYELDIFGLWEREPEVWEKALELANIFLTDYNLITS